MAKWLSLLLCVSLLASSLAFLPRRPGLSRVVEGRSIQSRRRAVPATSMNLLATEVVAQSRALSSTSVVVADFKSSVEGIVQTIGNAPWLQVFIPTAIGMFVGLTICFILYISAQPSYDISDLRVQEQEEQPLRKD